ncbi:flagellar basal-body MS-ring/collar protein FliF [Acidisphaera sp. S103]|uniref:flagellar basal-body MS-ring/collar protein FliF n=1 Tax=Acidisphaera sp. S103 TaxID=1747223 RepID=UPI00131A7706|nr:flagellar basal-body MS-ring/collar protein FliF [Acidisphaera sp. S103]
MKGLLDSIRKLGMVRVAMLVGVTLGIIGAFAWLEIQGPSQGRMTLLASDIDPQNAQQITAELTGRKIPYRLDGTQLFVPDSDLAAARALLTVSGLSGDNVTGYEIFDRSNDLAVTDFDQQVKLTRALEGELARTIVSVHGILHARVHIVLPRREPFAHDRLRAQASVMLTVPGRQILSPEAVQSIVDLVAAGVPGLRPQDVTVVDSNLHLLSQAGDGNDVRSKTAMEENIQQKTEARLAMAVEMMLEQTLGPGHVHAEASIRMNFDNVKETQEKFDPDGSVVRSTQNVTSNSKTTDKTGPVSLQNNLPNADAGAAAAAGTQEGKQEETTNYEIGKTVRAIVHDQPQIERITLAVMVDGTDVVGADGKHTWKARDQAELDQIAKLVKSAIGFDEKRGDQLDVVSMPFVSTLDTAEAAPASRPAKANGDLVTFLQMIAFGVVGFGIIILTARSIFVALNKQAVGLTIAGAAGEITDTTAPGIGTLQPTPLGIGHNTAENALATAEDDDIVTMSNIQGQLRASSIRKVTQLVDRHPDTTLGIIRGWIATDHG